MARCEEGERGAAGGEGRAVASAGGEAGAERS